MTCNVSSGMLNPTIPYSISTAMDYAVARCLSVCLSHASILSKRLYTVSPQKWYSPNLEYLVQL